MVDSENKPEKEPDPPKEETKNLAEWAKEEIENKEEADDIEEPEEEPCTDCLEEATKPRGSFYVEEETEEQTKMQEQQIMQELKEKEALHLYRASVDAKTINTLIIIGRRLGTICHELHKANEINREYLDFVKRNVPKEVAKKETNLETQNRIYSKFPQDLRIDLNFVWGKDEAKIYPKKFLGVERWVSVTKIVQSLDGEWNKLEKNSHWSVPK